MICLPCHNKGSVRHSMLRRPYIIPGPYGPWCPRPSGLALMMTMIPFSFTTGRGSGLRFSEYRTVSPIPACRKSVSLGYALQIAMSTGFKGRSVAKTCLANLTPARCACNKMTGEYSGNLPAGIGYCVNDEV